MKGLAILFTGLPSSGKSTLAKALATRIEKEGRTVTRLDGDEVRRALSSELGFSRNDRDMNVQRAGFVANEVVRHGGIAILSMIAPYDAARKALRAMIEPLGAFVLVYVATPLEICESRDAKGLYKEARAGRLERFTGVSDPYEPPRDADIVVDTDATTSMLTDGILGLLGMRGLIPEGPASTS